MWTNIYPEIVFIFSPHEHACEWTAKQLSLSHDLSSELFIKKLVSNFVRQQQILHPIHRWSVDDLHRVSKFPRIIDFASCLVWLLACFFFSAFFWRWTNYTCCSRSSSPANFRPFTKWFTFGVVSHSCWQWWRSKWHRRPSATLSAVWLYKYFSLHCRHGNVSFNQKFLRVSSNSFAKIKFYGFGDARWCFRSLVSFVSIVCLDVWFHCSRLFPDKVLVQQSRWLIH